MKENPQMKISAMAALVAVVSIIAASAVQAGGAAGGIGGEVRGASASPLCDGTGRAQTAHNARLPGDHCPVLAGDGPPGVGDNNGRSSAALSQGGAGFLVASIRGGSTGDF